MPEKSGILSKFPSAFWWANLMELFERLAWYGLFGVLALYLTGSTDEGALGFSQSQKGTMMGVVTSLLYFLPLFTGALADKLGYKKVLLAAYAVLGTGYFFMGQFSSYAAVFGAFLVVALGAALFKPIITATVSKTTTAETSSIGFGIFYMLVNIGGFIGPFIASKVRGVSWEYVFYVSTAAMLVNITILLLFFKEPERQSTGESFGQSVKNSLKNILLVLSDWSYVGFLVIIVGFWTMFNQIFYTLPNYIDQWVDTRPLYDALHSVWPWLAESYGEGGLIKPEMMINLDAGMIILFQVLVSALVMRWKAMNAMVVGILVSSIGVGIAFMTSDPMYVVLGIAIFAFGEMGSSPKFTEYVGLIAPSDKKALYMGTSYLPIAAGNFVAGIFAGPVYQSLSDKPSLAQREMEARGIELPAISEQFTQNDYMAEAARSVGMDAAQFGLMLQDRYQPEQIWYLFTGIGLATVVALFLYDRFVIARKGFAGH